MYRLDLSEYTTKAGFLDSILRQLGSSFDRLCQLLAGVGDCGLLLDNAPTEAGKVAEVEGIVSVIREYCPELKIILRSRTEPANARLAIVRLSALDKADLISYISDHELGDRSCISAEAVERLHTYTDGIPSRVDRALKELQVVSLADLVNSDAEISSGAVSPDIPETLALTIERLALSDNDTLSRSFGLLKVLSLFPQGESLARIRHFYSTRPFFPLHATELRDQGLIETVIVQRLDTSGEDASPKILLVPRLAREGVRKILRDDEVFQLNRRAAELYFGANWSAGTYKPPPAYRFDRPHCSVADLTNANIIIIRLLRESSASPDRELTERVLGLAISHVTTLFRGHHYQSASIFCDDVLSVVSGTSHEEKIALIKYIFRS
ncbi:MAG: hypothetical protein V7632_1791 [Bradyrhizobium sp.]